MRETIRERYARVRFRALASNLWDGFFRHNCVGLASEVAFWAMYSLFPFVIFLVALSGLLPFVRQHENTLRAVRRFLPASVFDVIGPTVENLLIEPSGWLAFGTLFLALWAASRAVSSLVGSLNRVYEVRESRPYWKARGIAVLLTFTIGAIYILALAMLVIGPAVSDFILDNMGLSRRIDVWYRLLRLGTVALTMTGAFTLIYVFAPDYPRNRRPIFPGAVCAVAGWFGVSALFSNYLKHIADFNRFYGTMGAVVILMTWLYLVGLMIVLGGLLNAELERLVNNRNGGAFPVSNCSRPRPES